ncbi:hypothetical protein RHMOL_Rhmol11G0238200 [Rhododendron molle]|uniref:Uncharacterized protein n=1 Tax=Rhododendron molle TaxID=49168 RepID=A0ACC0LWR9_RHOML|nr:hypothetical protein RHMOL_Rhmol11G0238200 [Rhododendron molle]
MEPKRNFGAPTSDQNGDHPLSGGNEYSHCGEEPERKDVTSRPLKRDIISSQRCASKLSIRQVIISLMGCTLFL